ncbi:hypothetical protein N7468_008924 [Penicillium chermesinum]|uniref:UDP-glucoronosyl and UDP-glucosyl transferase n=1 Tax=Penicillium chermesinum TaxID=63820 RepID=A0A9W9NGS2_9EURO|nr:uncharacterized protein N7468_008924 [Penicillium chermesinum]KAJ5219720.1 hypothetical protein N7468_008924 [Penicillium chermesinum]
MGESVTPPRKILLVATTGGFTHAAPILEIGRVLAERGHTIEFATLNGQEDWVKAEEYSFVTHVHLLGPGPTHEQLEGHYRRMQGWDISKGVVPVLRSKSMFDSFWPQTYFGLKRIVDTPETRPSAIIADFFVEAANDIHYEYNLPIAVVSPTWPLLQLPCPYIPGHPLLRLPGTMTSEDASLLLRIKNELVIVPDLLEIKKILNAYQKMRDAHGVHYPPHRPKKPDYLIFVNSFNGLEIPRDLPPTCAPVGPLLSPTWAPLDPACQAFFESHKSVLYIALGTHIILPQAHAVSIIKGVSRLIEEGLLDGVIWAMAQTNRADLDREAIFEFNKKDNKKTVSLGELLDGKDGSWHFSFFAPQRAILDHPSTKLYFTHGGGSSANEALFHGKPVLSMGIFSDQIENTTRLVAGGVGESLSKLDFTAEELYAKGKKILSAGDDGPYHRNTLRLQRIAHVAARRKYYAADLVEELIYDHELRIGTDGKVLRPMHLQTADSRMPAWKAMNLDMYAVGLVGVSAFLGAVLASGLGLWRHRALLANQGAALLACAGKYLRSLSVARGR